MPWSNGGPYKSANWTPLIFWTQPTSVRMGEGMVLIWMYIQIHQRDIFNISFTSEEVQDFIKDSELVRRGDNKRRHATVCRRVC